MSTAMVKLRPHHRAARPIYHEFLAQVPPPLTSDELESIRNTWQTNNGAARQQLILGHLAMLRHTVGRYTYHWPVCRRFVDEMVSAGLLALVRAAARLSKIEWPTLVGIYLLNNVCAEIEDEVARLRGLCPAAPSTNRRRVNKGAAPVYGEAESNLASQVFLGGAYADLGFDVVDTLDTLSQLRREVPQLSHLLDVDAWGLSDRALADQLGVSRQTVQRNRVRLLTRYFELAGD